MAAVASARAVAGQLHCHPGLVGSNQLGRGEHGRIAPGRRHSTDLTARSLPPALGGRGGLLPPQPAAGYGHTPPVGVTPIPC